MEKIGLYADELRASWPPPKDTRRLTLERTVDTFPIPGWTPPDAPKAALFTVPRAAIVPGIDGEIITEEWGGADAARAMVLEQELDGSVTGPRSWAWLQRDDQYLYLAVRSEVNPGRPLKTGATWGQDDSVEVALRGGTPPKPGGSKVQALLFVLRGYPKGQFESSTEAGAPADAAGKLQAAVRYAARVVDAGHWCAEWRIPFAALGIDPTKQARIPFNITVRKTAGGQWCMWRGTIDKATWSVDDAGEIVLEK